MVSSDYRNVWRSRGRKVICAYFILEHATGVAHKVPAVTFGYMRTHGDHWHEGEVATQHVVDCGACVDGGPQIVPLERDALSQRCKFVVQLSEVTKRREHKTYAY